MPLTTADTASHGARDLAGISAVHAQVDALGFGWYQALLLLGVGVSSLVESMEMGVVGPLHTALARAYGLSRTERSLLPLLTYLGSMVGMIVAGPLADLWGRKRGLVLAQVLICAACCLHAVLPAHIGFGALVVLRLVSGVSGAMGIPTGISLAVESCPQKDRLRLVFGISFLGSLGYLLEAMGIQWFMPHFGEEATDNWRGLCLFCGIPALATLPLVLVLRESPTFLAISGRPQECIDSLDSISYWNGVPRRIEPVQRRTSKIWRRLSISATRGPTLWGLAMHYLPVLVLLVLVDSMRSFFVSGSAYLCKDLFELTRMNQSVSPPFLNIIASISPLVGLIIGERCVWMGVRTIMLGGSVIAAASLAALASEGVRSLSWLLLVLVLCYKLTYGPLGTCVSVMKVEAFPTEFRGTAFAAICVAGKLLCALGPTLVEALKEEEAASSWRPKPLAIYLFSLAAAVLVSGLLALAVPVSGGGEEGVPLQDFSKLDGLDSDDEQDLKAKARTASADDYGSVGKRAAADARA